MGRSKIVPVVIRLTCRSHRVTPMTWHPEYGRPTSENVSRYVVLEEASHRPGGVNYHSSDVSPFIIDKAVVHCQLTDKTLVVWDRKMTPSNDLRVIAIRRDPVIGRGSCSVVDECYEDIELIAELEDEKYGKKRIKTPTAAVRYFREMHKLRLEREEDVRNA